MKKPAISYTVLFVLMIVLVVVSVSSGSVRIGFIDLQDETSRFIVFNMRLPKTIGALCIGICLSVSGLVFQTVFRNPMADSYILGVSSSSSFAVCLALVMGLKNSSFLALPFCAFAGAMLCTLTLFLFGKGTTIELLLKGIAINFLFSSLTNLLLFLNRNLTDNFYFWTMGSLNALSWEKVFVLVFTSAFSLIFLETQNMAMDMLLLDDSTSVSSGVDIKTKRLVLIAVASFATSVCVSFTGIIGFTGLMCPHIARAFSGPKHKNLILLSALCGADLMLIAEIISNTIIAPSVLPIGVVTAVIGSPVLIVLIRRRNIWKAK